MKKDTTTKKKSDKEIILQDKEWVECYICRDVFSRKRETYLYCNTCGRGFCNGEHGSFLKGNIGCCIHCNSSLKNE